ncbi:MAG: CDP-glucose 4,6-dehydratase [Patescibacteria group bacterium]
MQITEFIKGKKFLVTGHTGFKGAWLTKIILQFGGEVSGYALAPNTSPSLFEALGLKSQIENHFGDIRDLEKFDKVVAAYKPDVILHLAAQPLVRASYDKPVYTFEANVIGTVNVLESIRRNKIKSGVIITTDKVYKNLEKDVLFKEEDALGGHDPYSASKACTEIVADSYIKSFFSTEKYKKDHETLIATARAGNVIGGGDWAEDRLIPDVVRSLFTTKETLILRNPSAVRPWQHVFESLYGYLLLACRLHNGEKNFVGAWNFGPEKSDMLKVEEIIKKLLGILGNYKVCPDPAKPEMMLLKLDNSRAKELLKWKTTYNIDQAVETTAAWYRAFFNEKNKIGEFSESQIKEYFHNK